MPMPSLVLIFLEIPSAKEIKLILLMFRCSSFFPMSLNCLLPQIYFIFNMALKIIVEILPCFCCLRPPFLNSLQNITTYSSFKQLISQRKLWLDIMGQYFQTIHSRTNWQFTSDTLTCVFRHSLGFYCHVNCFEFVLF